MCLQHILKTFLVLGAAFVLASCGKENIGSEADRQMDRDHETSNVIAKSYEAINGTYSGTINNSDVFLVIDTTKVTKAGSLVPTPTLVGKLVFSPRIAVDNAGERVKESFPFRDGSYDSNSGDFSFSVEQDQRASEVRCKASKPTISCSWYGRMNDTAFVVTRDKDDALDKLDAASKGAGLFGGSYVGHTTPDNFLVQATFNTGLVNLPDSMIPELRVIGNFRIFSQSQLTPSGDASLHDDSPFTDGLYDVSSGTISMTVTVNGSSTPVNCTVKSAALVSCRWFARTYYEFILTRTNKK